MFSDADRKAIAQAISQAEQGTSGEIVALVTPRSDDYRFIPLLWAALLALALPLLLIFVPRLSGWRFAFQGPEVIYLIQLVWFVVLALFFQIPAVRIAITPSFIKRRRVRQKAMEQFLAQNLHSTSGRTGVLIFVSVAERQAEIIADSAIASQVDPSVWQEAINHLTSRIGAGRPGEGFVGAIRICGSILAAHFPPGQPNGNELPNHLIELG